MYLNRFSDLKSKKIFYVVFSTALILIMVASGAYAAESSGIVINISLPALPVITGLTQGVEITLPDGAPDGIFEAEVNTESGWGVLLFQAGPSDSGKIRVSKGAPAVVEYRWSGISPVNSPALETIKASIPEIGLSGEISFNVGVDLRVKEVSLPPQIIPGIFNKIEIILEDAFNPSLDIAALAASVGVKPEVAMSLSGGAAITGDPVVSAFFNHVAADGSQSYPGNDLIPGSIVTENGKFLWRCDEGKPSGITPPSSGGFNIEVTLKSNLGGSPLKQWSSSTTRPSDSLPSIAGLPEFITSAIGIMSQLNPDAAAEAETAARNSLASGNENTAAMAIGAPLLKSFGDSPVQSLGKFSSALAASGKNEAEIVGFLEAVVKAFDNSGVLLFTRNGVDEWRLSSGAFAYENDRYVAVPFSNRQNITLTLFGSSSDDVSLWKIIPEGTNTKMYEKGLWIKEITVFTAEVQPSH